MPKTIALPSGKTAQVIDFKGRHIREAQKVAGTETEKYLFALIAATTTIDEKPVVMEDVDEMDGFDVLELMKAFGSGNS